MHKTKKMSAILNQEAANKALSFIQSGHNGCDLEAGLALSVRADNLLHEHKGSSKILEEFFELVALAAFPERVLRALLINTRALGLTIPARELLIDKVCSQQIRDGKADSVVDAMRQRFL